MPAGSARIDWARSRALISEAKRLVCLTGAGISAESGIPTFREAKHGMWARFNPEDLASEAGFRRDPLRVWRWYRSRYESLRKAKPNPGHTALSDLQQNDGTCQILTQNVDNLHERSGSNSVWHLHGEISRCHCLTCEKPWSGNGDVWDCASPPQCPCGGMFRPSVIWFGETLDTDVWQHCRQATLQCDVMLVVGTSGSVAPAAELPFLAQNNGAVVVDVNPEMTDISRLADLWLKGSASEILPKLAPEAKA